MEASLLKCIVFDQDSFLDIRRSAAEDRQSDWENSYLPEVSECSRSDILYSRTNFHTKLAIEKKDMDIINLLCIDNVMLLGSSQDGLYLEKGFPIIDMDKGDVNETDVDIVFEFHGVEILQNISKDINIPSLAIEKSCFPGYVLLKIFPCDYGRPTYFNPKALKKQLMIALENANFCVYKTGPSLLPDGPALSGTFEDELGIHQIDFVASLTMKTWPDVAKSFVYRKREHGWPPISLIMTIKSKGCGFVGVGHPFSSRRHLEWRISFSSAERLLIYSLTNVQIRAYLFFKTIFKLKLSEDDDCLSSYMMKNILFWILEENSSEIWREDNMLGCVEAMLDKLTYCLEICYIPNYFVPDRNMISHKNKSVIELLYKKCFEIQGDVLGTIVQCAQSNDFKGICDVDLPRVLSRCENSLADTSNMILSVIYFLIYLNIRLVSRRYQINLSIGTIRNCSSKQCASLFQMIPPRAAWYIIQSILHIPDISNVKLFKYKDSLVFDIAFIRTAAAKFIKTDLYTGTLKDVVNDQEFVTNETVSVLPPYKTLVDWVDMTSVWNGGKALNIANLTFPENLD